MLRLLGLNPYLRALIGIGLLVAGIVTHRPLLIAVGAGVGLWSVVNVVMDAKGNGHRDRPGRDR
jgi:hypothetical protein